jgi:hypothetical protein
MEQELTKRGISYEYCTFTKKNLWEGIANGCNFIIIFEDQTETDMATKFVGDNQPGSMRRMFDELYKIEKVVPIYPPIHTTEYIASKMYLTTLPHRTDLLMPYMKCFEYYKTTAKKHLVEIQAYFKRVNITRIIIKFGYSGNTQNVYSYSTDSILEDPVKSQLLEEMANHRIMVGCPFLVIVQPFNPVVADRLTEYRLLCIGNKLSPIAAFGYRLAPDNTHIYIPSIELDPECNEIHATIMSLAKYGYAVINKFLGDSLVFARVDVTWMVLEDGSKHYYINEFENLSGTFYFGLFYQPKKAAKLNRITDVYECDRYICSAYPRWIQHNLIRELVNVVVKNHIPETVVNDHDPQDLIPRLLPSSSSSRKKIQDKK